MILRRSLLGALLALQATLAVAAPDLSAVAAKAPRHRLPEGWFHGAFMEVFVRAYQDSDGDGIGDLRGLIARLDHLKALGVKGLWLMPVTPSADGDHGYATTDYRAIEPAYGTLADFDELLRQAHRRGIGVIVDYVINHSAATHPLFQESLKGPQNRFRDWYVWSEAAPLGWDIWGQNPWYHGASEPWLHKGPLKELPVAPPGATGHFFGTFGPHMPDFNLKRPEVLAYHLGSLNFWLNRGLDGFRLDAVPHMIERDAANWNDQPESRALTKRLQDSIKAYPGRYVVCEATAQPQAYGDPAVCGGAFAFGHVHHYVQAALGKAESVQRLAEYYRTASPTMATFVSNHDRFAGARLWDQVEGDSARYKLAAAGYLLQPGTPFIYYGEEVGQAGVAGLPGDMPLRAPMSWAGDSTGAGFTTGRPFRPLAPNLATHNVQVQTRDPASILNFYKAMLKLRNTLPSIARGSFEASFAEGLVLGFQRQWQQERTLVLINYGTEAIELTVPSLPAAARVRRLWPAGRASLQADHNGNARAFVPAQSVAVYLVRR